MRVSQRMRRCGRNAFAVGLAVSGLLGMGKAANAQLIADDNFSYPVGYLVNLNGGFGWLPSSPEFMNEGKWSDFNPVKVTNPGLTYPGLGALGNTATTGGYNQGAYRSLAVNQGSANGTNTVYVSFLARKNPDDPTPIGGGSGTYAGISLFDGFAFGSQERFFMGMPYESANWSFARAGEPASVPSNVPVNTTVHLFVYRFDFTTSNVDVKLFIDPPTTAEPAIASVQALGLPGFSFQQVRIQSGTQDLVPNIDFDELKIARDYATAVGVSLSGRVTDYGGNPNPTGYVLIATFKNNANAVVATRTSTLDAQGNFAFTSIPRGTYKVIFSGRKVLGLAVNNLNLTNAVSGQNLVLLGGDATGDNFVDIADLLILIGAYNKTLASNPNEYIEAADFNGDGVNDISDLLLLIANYNKQGAF